MDEPELLPYRPKNSVFGPARGGILDGLDEPFGGSGLELFMSPEEIAGIEGLKLGSEQPVQEAGPRLAEVRQDAGQKSSPNVEREFNPYDRTRPELERVTKDPGIAKAMDDYYVRSQYSDPKNYKGEPGFYIMENSSGRV